MNDMLRSLTRLIYSTDAVLIFAGAGMSVEIGNKPYWAGKNARYGGETTKHGLTPLQHATEEAWVNNPQQQTAYVKETQETFLHNLQSSKTNLYTELLKSLQKNNIDYHVVTSNVDNAFLYYGYDANNIYEKHGNYFYAQCSEHRNHPVIQYFEATKTCEECGALLRPNVLMFGDTKFSTVRETEQWYKYDDHFNNLIDNKKKTLILEIGVGATVLNIRDTATKAYYLLKTAPFVHLNPIPEDINNYSQIALLTSREKPTGKELWIPRTSEELTKVLQENILEP